MIWYPSTAAVVFILLRSGTVAPTWGEYMMILVLAIFWPISIVGTVLMAIGLAKHTS